MILILPWIIIIIIIIVTSKRNNNENNNNNNNDGDDSTNNYNNNNRTITIINKDKIMGIFCWQRSHSKSPPVRIAWSIAFVLSFCSRNRIDRSSHREFNENFSFNTGYRSIRFKIEICRLSVLAKKEKKKKKEKKHIGIGISKNRY